jgi:hypothetical protein
MIANKWYTSKNEVKESIIPPLKEIKISYLGQVITASPFKIKNPNTRGDVVQKDLNKEIQQNSYTNQILSSLAKQVPQLDNNSTLRQVPNLKTFNPKHPIDSNPIINPVTMKETTFSKTFLKKIISC